jgi:4-hydroxymandelate oxidase
VLPLLRDHRRAAARLLPPEVFAYYAGGSGEERSLREAHAAWGRARLLPRVLRDVSRVDTGVTVLGQRCATPVLVAPTASHGLAHPDGEVATAAGTAAAGSLLVLSTRADRPVAEVAAVAGPWWYQVYLLRDRALTAENVRRAAAAGASAVVLTGDTPYVGRKRRTGEVPRGAGELGDPAATLADIGWLAAAAGLPVLVKGVLRADEAAACVAAGAAGVIVSNHGGRQLDRALATAEALPPVARALRGSGAEVYVDGGIRSGLDVLVALASGARAVLLGRPVLWALAAGGAAGVTAALDAVTDDLAHVLALAGARRLSEVTDDLLAPAPGRH